MAPMRDADLCPAPHPPAYGPRAGQMPLPIEEVLRQLRKKPREIPWNRMLIVAYKAQLADEAYDLSRSEAAEILLDLWINGCKPLSVRDAKVWLYEMYLDLFTEGQGLAEGENDPIDEVWDTYLADHAIQKEA